jgi:uncharacterized membrane protein YozB (DUF420 family)
MLRNIPSHLASLCTVLWVGGIWAVGYLAVPVLFQSLPDRQLAGLLAGKMFSLMAYVGIGCAVYLLANQIRQFGINAWKHKTFILIASMLALLFVGQFVIQPFMAALKAQAFPLDVMQSSLASQFKVMHGLASILYLIQSLLGLVLVISIPK